MVVHFNSSKERLDFLKGKHEEIIPTPAKEKKKSKPKKKTAKDEKKEDGKVQAK